MRSVLFISMALWIAGCQQSQTDRVTERSSNEQHWERSWGEQTSHTPEGELRDPLEIRTVSFESGTRDERFLREAASGGRMEVELGRMATRRGVDPRVRRYGQRMVDDHQKSNQDLKRVAARRDVIIPDGLAPPHQAMIEQLSRSHGEEFDREYIRMMVGDHLGVVGKFDEQSRNGLDPQARDFAESTLPTLRDHLREAQEIARELGIEQNDEGPRSTHP